MEKDISQPLKGVGDGGIQTQR